MTAADTSGRTMTDLRGRRGYRFENWAKTYTCRPTLFFEPETENEVAEIVFCARQEGETCRAIGAGHSPSDLACTKGYMIGLDKLNRLVEVDQTNCQVTVQAGMRLHDLHQHLAQHNLGFCNLGSISDQSVAGAMATATHGTGTTFGVLSTMVTRLTLVTASGQFLTCSESEQPHVFRAAQCSLGCLGIIVRLTLQCEPAFRLHATETLIPMNDVLTQLETIAHSAEHVRLWWFPDTDEVVVWRANRTTKTPSRIPSLNWFRDRLLGFYTYEFLLYLSRFAPRLLVPAIARHRVSLLHTKQTETIDDSYRVFNFDCLFSQHVNEWSIPMENTADAIRRLRAVIRRRDFSVHSPIEIRFTAADDIWLSPAYKRNICYIGVIMYRPYNSQVPYKRYWSAYESIMRDLDGRPHWSKAHSLHHKDLSRLYPRLEDFLNVRQQLDPAGIFLNAYLRRHLLPSCHATNVQAKL